MPELPGLWSLTPFGAVLGLMVLMYWLMATGRLYTRKQHEEGLALERLRGTEWKETSQKWETLASAQSSQLTTTVHELGIIGDFLKKTPLRQAPQGHDPQGVEAE